MAGFKFRLETFLKLKEQFEKNARIELGAAIMKLEEEKSKLKVIEDNIDITTNDLRDACSGVIRPEKIKDLKAYLKRLQHEKDKQKEVVKRQQKHVDIIREKLVEIMRERKVLENLKEREFQEYLKEENKKEQQQIDELVSFKESNNTTDLLDDA